MRPALVYIALFASAFILLSFNNGGLWIYSLDEAKNASAAREMLERGDHIVPTFNYELRTDKPPLHYYFMMLSYLLFGVNEWSARLFSSLMGAFTILITYWWGARYIGKSVGLWAAFTLMASLHWNIQHHMAVPDPYLIFFFTASLMLFFAYFIDRKPLFLWLLYTSVGLGALSKGPIAIALPGLIILIFLVTEKHYQIKQILAFKPFWGALLVLFICVPWYWAVHQYTDGEWTNEFFFKHNLGRYKEPMEGHGGFFLLPPLMVLVGMLPFSIFIVQTIRFTRHSWKKPAVKFCSIIVLVIVIFFAFSGTKLPNYTVPAYPFLAILLGNYLCYSISSGRWSAKPGFVLALISLLLPPAVFIMLMKDPYLKGTEIAALSLIPIFIGSAVSLFYCQKRLVLQSLISILSGWIVAALLFFGWGFPLVDRQNPVAKILPSLDTSLDFYHYKRFNASFAFYLQKPIPQLTTQQEIINKMADGKPFYLISRRSFNEEIEGLPGLNHFTEAKDIFESPHTTVFLFTPKPQ
jgi:4-amino-4-deoxy-L-arabinose transferase-like glycosyltransferase